MVATKDLAIRWRSSEPMRKDTDHYFSSTPHSPSEPFELHARVGELELTLLSDRGVFSKDRPDAGTLLLAKRARLPETGTVLDLGCGYGLLGIAAALRHPGLHLTFVDLNPRAVELARKNCERYRLAQTDFAIGDAPQVLGDRCFDAILCNPPYRAGKAMVMALLQDAALRLNPGGALWIVGRTRQGIKTLARDISSWFSEIETVDISGGYRVVRCAKG